MFFKLIYFLWITTVFIQSSVPKHQHKRYTGRFRNNNRSPSHRFTQNLKLFPGGTEKRTVYTGRYCAYPTTRRVPHRVKNGTETYLQRIVSQCPWSSLYCSPRVRYAVSSRHSYKIKMKEITRDEWRCCPGFHGSNCEKACFNCTTARDLKKKIEELTRQISFVPPNEKGQSVSEGIQYLRGPVGPPGPMGLRGQRGYPGSVGPKGDVGAVGPRGFPGVAGSMGETGAPGTDGSPGLNGSKGQQGEKGEQGIAGPVGIGGSKGENGATGSVGAKGDMGPAGPTGLGGEPGGPGPAGPIGPEGRRGPTGIRGPPGPPGVCKCDSGSSVVTDILRNEDNGSNACVYEGESRRHKEVWKSSVCRECNCFEGSVKCFNISCPVTSCQYTYKPSDFCCPVCCPNQDGDYAESMSGDGAEETLSNADNETSPQPGYDSEEEIEDGETDNSNSHRIPTNVAECPTLSVTARRFSSSQTSQNAIPVCAFRKDPGPCRALIPKLYFDSTSMKCRPFTYGGCEGNANNFDTPQECRRRCGGANDSLHRSRHDDVRSRRPRRCNRRKAIGDCRAHMPRFYYNRREGRCHLFIYGGCNGNDNRFSTPWECRDVCGGSTPVFNEGQQRKKRRKHRKRKPTKCYLPKVEGTCKSSQPRFYYNHATRKCQIFTYGGCGGNENNFKLPTECKAVCGGKPNFRYEKRISHAGPVVGARSSHTTKDIRCTKSLDSGPCKGGFYRYFFNSQTNKCSVFLYGGCRGNENNFATAEECGNTCGGDGFNFTLTLESDLTEKTSSDATENGRRGPRGHPGPRGKPGLPGAGIRGPPGPRGPAGPPGTPATVSSSTTDEIRAIKATIESLKSRIVFLETQFLTDLAIAENTEEVNVPSIVFPSESDDLLTTVAPSSDATMPLVPPQGSPIGRGDAYVEDKPPY